MEARSASAALVAPAPTEGEALPDYIQRIIADDPQFRRLQAAARGLRFEVSLPWSFRPGCINDDIVNSFHDLYVRSGADPRDRQSMALIDHLWIGRDPRILPIDLRMAGDIQPDLGDRLPGAEANAPERDSARRLAATAARFRDARLLQICASLRTGNLVAMGFVPGDQARTMVPISTAWWADDQMVCHWRAGELKPRQDALGRPTFLGVALRQPLVTAATAIGDTVPGSRKRKPGPKADKSHNEMRSTLVALLSKRNEPFPTTVAAYQAVLGRLGIKAPPRGYSLDTFGKVCADLLTGDKS